MPLEIGVQISPQHADFHTMRSAWVQAEELGADMIFTWDHFYPLSGESDGKHFEGLTSLMAMAEATERAQIGALVFCNSYRNPQYLADAHRTIDHASGGRVIFGIGAGWFERDYDEFGYEFGEARDRLRSLKENLPLMKERLGKGNPAPVREIPFLIGGSGPKVTLRLVAEHAKYWHGFGTVDHYTEKSAILAEHCQTIGRDPSDVTHTFGVFPRNVDEAEGLVEAGVEVITISISGAGGYDLAPLRELIEYRNAFNAV